MSTISIILAGFGGQGILFAGKFLAYKGLVEDKKLSWLPSYGPEYIERVAVNNVKNVKNAKKAIEKAFRNQVEGKGFSLIEVVSTCPTNWGMTPQKALGWIDEKMIPYYPLGVYKDRSAKEAEEK